MRTRSARPTGIIKQKGGRAVGSGDLGLHRQIAHHVLPEGGQIKGEEGAGGDQQRHPGDQHIHADQPAVMELTRGLVTVTSGPRWPV